MLMADLLMVVLLMIDLLMADLSLIDLWLVDLSLVAGAEAVRLSPPGARGARAPDATALAKAITGDLAITSIIGIRSSSTSSSGIHYHDLRLMLLWSQLILWDVWLADLSLVAGAEAVRLCPAGARGTRAPDATALAKGVGGR
jgi:hypothetical protein